VACEILGVACDWQESMPFDRTRTIAPVPVAESSPEAVQLIFDLQHNGTHGSYVSLIEGQADIILVARQPSEDELQQARRRRVTLDVRPAALDAFVFLVSAKNPIEELSLDAIRQIYTGEVTRWGDLGVSIGTGEAEDGITTYRRNPNSGSQELMEKLVMRGEPMIESPDLMLMTMMGPFMAIASDPLGIGYSVYYYAVFMLPTEEVKLIGVDGVLPTSENIAARSYPLTTEVYVATREGMPADHTALLLRDWLLTSEGQAVIAKSGYVPIMTVDLSE
jgi:phosphate transport system substrate-binding protein